MKNTMFLLPLKYKNVSTKVQVKPKNGCISTGKYSKGLQKWGEATN